MNAALPAINISFIVVSAICIAIGWFYIRRGNRVVHKRWMLTGSVLAALFFIGYVVKTVAVGDTQFGGPSGWKFGYQTFLQIHSILATVGGVLGLISLILAYRQSFRRHKKLGPWTSIVWFITAGSGLMVFLLLYVVFQPGPTTNVWNAWLGH